MTNFDVSFLKIKRTVYLPKFTLTSLEVKSILNWTSSLKVGRHRYITWRLIFIKVIKFFCCIENNADVTKNLDRISQNKNVKSIETFNFSILHTKIPHCRPFNNITYKVMSMSKDRAYCLKRVRNARCIYIRCFVLLQLYELNEYCFYIYILFRVENCHCIFSYFRNVFLDAILVETFPYLKRYRKFIIYITSPLNFLMVNIFRCWTYLFSVIWLRLCFVASRNVY